MNKIIELLKDRIQAQELEHREYIKDRVPSEFWYDEFTEEVIDELVDMQPMDDRENTCWESGYMAWLKSALNIIELNQNNKIPTTYNI